ncbi:MAG: DNA mismatch repair protein MutS, partial [Acidobacteria bacterium]|nr:DNA mismatch repair protein MutS [Acidobacteriota bacterium]
MRQYLDAKRQYRDAIVFFRMGDFYEMFYEDALTASRALDLTLTSRSKDSSGGAIPMCGIPHHAADSYLARLVQKGFKVAICEQIEDAKKSKGLVRREVVRVISPGSFTDTGYLEEREPTYLMCLVAIPSGVAPPKDAIFGMALLDLSTGSFVATEYDGEVGRQGLSDDISLLRPREVLLPQDSDLEKLIPEGSQSTVTKLEPWN